MRAPAGERRELQICLLIAVAIVALRSVIPLWFEQVFDADQAVYGLMAKHLSEGRTFPLFFYGQNYMLGVHSWMAVPFFWIGGATVTMLRLPLVFVNLAVAIAFILLFVRRGVRPWYALAAALPVIAFTPSVSVEFGSALGVGIEPLGYLLVLWYLRQRPAAFGAMLGFGTLHREFTFLALPALLITEWRNRAIWSVSSLARRAAAFAAVWIVVDLIKRNVNALGPAGGTWASGSLFLGPKTFASWLSFRWDEYSARVSDLVTSGIPMMLGVRPHAVRPYGIPSAFEAGSRVAAAALALAAIVALARIIWVARRSETSLGAERQRVCFYFALAAAGNVVLYGLNSGIVVGLPIAVRYAVLTPLLALALFGWYFLMEQSRRWATAMAVVIAVWAGSNLLDNARLVREFVATPPPRPHRVLADYLVAEGIRYARAGYWDAYVVTFLSQERVIVASRETIRISAYQAEYDQHAAEAVTLQRLPCDSGTKVAAWCVVAPTGKDAP